MKIKRSVLLMLAILFVAILAILWIFSDIPIHHRNLEEIRLAIPAKVDNMLLIFAAEDQGYFKTQGLKAIIKEYPTGVLTMDALAKGDVDVAAAAEYVFAQNVLNKKDVKTFGTVASTNNTEMIARKDSGIQKPIDLRGKKIGLVVGSISEFFLGTFLAFNDLSPSSIHMVSLPPAKMTESLSKGIVDAIINWNPYTFETKKRLGVNSISWAIQREQNYYLLLISKSGFLETKPEVVKKFLRALLQAEEYVKNHQPEAQKLVQKKCGFDPDEIAAIWQNTSYQVRLPQNLILLMEDETRWLQEKKSQKVKMPDFFSCIDLQGLSAIKPEAVGIIH